MPSTAHSCSRYLCLPFWVVATLTVLFIIFVITNLDKRVSLDNNGQRLSYTAREWHDAFVLARSHDFISGNANEIVYNGRWMPTVNRLRNDASFPGVGLEFAVYNTTSILISLANLPTKAFVQDAKEEKIDNEKLALTPAQMALKPARPVNILLSINQTTNFGVIETAYGDTTIFKGLERLNVHRISVTLLPGTRPATMQLEGVWLDKGGKLIRSAGTSNASFPPVFPPDAASLNGIDQISMAPHPRIRRKLIEVMAASPLLAHGLSFTHNISQAQTHTFSWSSMIESHFLNSTVSTLPISPQTCLTRRCQSSSSMAVPLAQDIFFRAGPPKTQLYNRLWPFGSSTTDTPTALILSLGLADVEAFIWSPESKSKRNVDAFIHDLSTAYAQFIMAVRRTAYSPSSLASSGSYSQILLHDTFGEEVDKDVEVDESYLYNSSPSNIPIFLVLPPLPSPGAVYPQAQEAKKILHHATSGVLSELKWHAGDRKTFVIDTAGWLKDEDFEFTATAGSSEPSGGKRGCTVSLKQSGHVKFAHHMALHLCHYMEDFRQSQAEDEGCPFDRHDEYVGNLYVPETANIGKLMEERKIAKVKELLGMKDRGGW